MEKVKSIGTTEEPAVRVKSGAAALTTDAAGNFLTPWEVKLQAKTERLLLTWERYESVRRFMRKISKVATRFAYLSMVNQYMAWLREAKGVTMDPDELVRDNLVCVYNSPPTDVKTKRRHTDWLDEYVNDYLLNRGVGTKRASSAAAVKMFYKRNDSQLVGDFSVADGRAAIPDRALLADDVRAVLKGIADGLVHKTEAGAVMLNLSGEAQVRDAAERMSAGLSARGLKISGFLVQPMLQQGVEMIVGATTDPTFGPVVACGAGGTLVELMKDVSVRITPITPLDASEMLHDLKTFPLLEGYRGAPACDVPALEEVGQRVSALADDIPEVIELDLNPVMVGPEGASVVDFRVRLGERWPAVPLGAVR
jgi:ATP-grasp domain